MGEIQNYQICFTNHASPAWFFASVMTSFSSPFLMGETTSSPQGFRRQQWNMTLSSGSQTNVCRGHRVAVLCQTYNGVISYIWWQHGKPLHSVTVATVGESLPEHTSEYGWVQAIVFLLQTHPQESLLGTPNTTLTRLQQPWSTGVNMHVLCCIDMCFRDQELEDKWTESVTDSIYSLWPPGDILWDSIQRKKTVLLAHLWWKSKPQLLQRKLVG